MANITVAVDDKQAQAVIARLLQSTANAKPLYETIGRVLVNRVRLCFKMGIDPWGNPWKAIKWRAPRRRSGGGLTRTGQRQAQANAGGTPGQPLRDTGRLNRSISSLADNSGVTVGTNVQYARTHQYGATIVPRRAKRLVFPGPGGEMVFAKKVVIPARPFLPLKRGQDVVALPPVWSGLVTRAIKAYFVDKVNKGSA